MFDAAGSFAIARQERPSTRIRAASSRWKTRGGFHHNPRGRLRQYRVATLMRVLHSGTNQARGKKLVVIA